MTKILSTLFLMFVIIVIPFGLRTADAQQQVNFFSVLSNVSAGIAPCWVDAFVLATTPTDAHEELKAGIELAGATGRKFQGIVTKTALVERGLPPCIFPSE